MTANEIAVFLSDLSEVQTRTLSLLQRKGELLAKSDAGGLALIAEEERRGIDDLQECLDRRERLLDDAKSEGLPSDSIESLGERLAKQSGSGNDTAEFTGKYRTSIHQTRLLQHQSLTNWMLTQRTLIHLSQLLEIIATKGRTHSTYTKAHCKELVHSSGAFVDRNA